MYKNKQNYRSRNITTLDKIKIFLNEKEWLIYFNINNNLITTNSKTTVIIFKKSSSICKFIFIGTRNILFSN